MTADAHRPGSADRGAGATRRALGELIRGSGTRPVASTEDLDRFRTSLWDSDEELEAFLADFRASRNAGI